jgi:hypothetical protein
MHPLTAYDIAKFKMADLQAEAHRERLAKTARIATAARKPSDGEQHVEGRWALRRLFARLHLAGSGA